MGRKRLKHLINLSYLLILLIIFFIFTNIKNVVADSNVKGLTLSPLRSEIELSSGSMVNGKLSVKNQSNETIKVSFSADEFKVVNQQYDYAFDQESEISKWVTFKNDRLILEPGQTKENIYSVGVPNSAEPGGYYISIFASTVSNFSKNAINSEQRIASLLYVTITGDVSRIGKLVSFSSPWLLTSNQQWSVLLQNKGTTHYRSRYSITFYSIFGQIMSGTKTGEALILPNTIRLITDDYIMPKWPGLYKVKSIIGLGDNPAKEVIRYVLFLPLWSILAILLFIIFLTILIVRKKKLIGLRHGRINHSG